MKLRLDPVCAETIQSILQSCPPETPIYLVGGAVRDILLEKPVKDLDFLLPHGSLQMAMRIRKALNGVAYTLDDQRQSGRVLLHQGQPQELILDFVSFTGDSLEEDLRHRDFTINAMAIELHELNILIDPLRGWQDLQQKCLRLASPQSLHEDPLRVLRAVRMARNYDLNLATELLQLLRACAPALQRVAPERIYDEVFKLLSLPGVAQSFALLAEFQILTVLFPTLIAHNKEQTRPEAFPKALEQISLLEKLFGDSDQVCNSGEPSGHSGSTQLQEQILHASLAPHGAELLTHLHQPLQPGKARLHYLYLAQLMRAFLPPSDMRKSEEFIPNWIQSRHEIDFLSRLLSSQAREQKDYPLPDSVEERRQLYHHYRQLGSAGLDAALLCLLENAPHARQQNDRAIRFYRACIRAWFREKDSLINPVWLLDGETLKNEFQLAPGPLIGKILEKLHEAQIIGLITTRKEALSLAKNLLQNTQTSL